MKRIMKRGNINKNNNQRGLKMAKVAREMAEKAGVEVDQF